MKTQGFIFARRLIAGAVLLAFGFLFAWGGSSLPGLELLASWQIGPAVLAGSVVFLSLQALAALIFGRLYCSLLCPLGMLQDLIGLFRRKGTYRTHASRSWLRLGILGIFTASLAGGYLFMYGALDPYSAFGRIASAIFGPLFRGLNNLLAWCADVLGYPILTSREIVFQGWPVLLTAGLSLAVLTGLSIKYGRMWCNYCPVGTALGLLGRQSFFRIRLDAQKCVGCGLCQKNCKTGCIDISKKTLDASRCVACLNCAQVCPKGAIAYCLPESGKARAEVHASKRAFMRELLPMAALLLAMPGQAQAGESAQKGKAIESKRERRQRKMPITPPGSRSLADFTAHCVGCQLCVSACPNDVLVSLASGTGPLQPELSFELGYCRPNCVKCAEACPAGAIEPINLAEKKEIRIGQASIDRAACIITRDKIPCTACQRICPEGAISLMALNERKGDPLQPVVDVEKCVGCGACEYVCPARPLAAITVSGHRIHKMKTLAQG